MAPRRHVPGWGVPGQTTQPWGGGAQQHRAKPARGICMTGAKCWQLKDRGSGRGAPAAEREGEERCSTAAGSCGEMLAAAGAGTGAGMGGGGGRSSRRPWPFWSSFLLIPQKVTSDPKHPQRHSPDVLCGRSGAVCWLAALAGWGAALVAAGRQGSHCGTLSGSPKCVKQVPGRYGRRLVLEEEVTLEQRDRVPPTPRPAWSKQEWDHAWGAVGAGIRGSPPVCCFISHCVWAMDLALSWLAVVRGGIWIALSCGQSACGIAHGGKRLFSFPLLSTVGSISPGEGNIWMSLVAKLSSKPVLTHWNQLSHSGLKIEEGESVPTWTGSWKMYLWPSLLCELSCKLSRTNYALHLWAANNSSPNSCQYRPLVFFPLQIFHLQRRHRTRSRDSATANFWSSA